MKRHYLGLMAAAGLLLSACSSQDGDDDSYVGWVCSGARNSDNWTCEMGEVRAGQPVVPKAPVKTTAAASPPSDQKQSAAVTEIAGFPSQEWRSQLPSLTSEPVLSQTGDSSTPEPIKKLPPRVAEPLAKARPELKNSSRPPVEQPLVQAVTEPAQPLHAVDVAGAGSGYTLQLGAFSDEPQLQAFIASHKLGDLHVRTVRAFSKQQYWQVLTWGKFTSPEEARSAWNAIAERYPGVEPWVRPVSSLDSAATPAATVDG